MDAINLAPIGFVANEALGDTYGDWGLPILRELDASLQEALNGKAGFSRVFALTSSDLPMSEDRARK